MTQAPEAKRSNKRSRLRSARDVALVPACVARTCLRSRARVQPERRTAKPQRALRAPRTHPTRRHFGSADVLPPVQALGATGSDDALARCRALTIADGACAAHNVGGRRGPANTARCQMGTKRRVIHNDPLLPRYNVKATGPPPSAAKPPCAGVGPCWPICYAWASPELTSTRIPAGRPQGKRGVPASSQRPHSPTDAARTGCWLAGTTQRRRWKDMGATRLRFKALNSPPRTHCPDDASHGSDVRASTLLAAQT